MLKFLTHLGYANLRDRVAALSAMLAKRPNWSRPLPRPLVIPTVVNLATLADVRALIDRHLPAHCRERPTWRYVRQKLDEAARGGDVTDVAVALQIALHLEGVECRPK